jgi:choline dehydrogenase-like flavoprotein
VLQAAQIPGFGRDHFRRMRAFAHQAGILALLHDRSEGSVRPGDSLARPDIRYALGSEDSAQLAHGLRRCAELLFASGAHEVLVPYRAEPRVLRDPADAESLERRGLRQGEIPLASTHPQSTCAMGADPRASVVGPFGETHDVRGLFVADMSVFPTSLGAPPQITTAALADRTAHHVLERWDELGAAS